MKDKLKPCPFCGGKAVYEFYADEDMDFEWHYVICTNCSIKTQEKKIGRDAIKAWNRRSILVSEGGLAKVIKSKATDSSVGKDWVLVNTKELAHAIKEYIDKRRKR